MIFALHKQHAVQSQCIDHFTDQSITLVPHYLFSLHYQYEPAGVVFLPVISRVSENPDVV